MQAWRWLVENMQGEPVLHPLKLRRQLESLRPDHRPPTQGQNDTSACAHHLNLSTERPSRLTLSLSVCRAIPSAAAVAD